MTYWRTWIRSHTPTWLHERGLVVPKRKECPSFECCEWYVAFRFEEIPVTELECYHCKRFIRVPNAELHRYIQYGESSRSPINQ